jgi:hypothetical protein
MHRILKLKSWQLIIPFSITVIVIVLSPHSDYSSNNIIIIHHSLYYNIVVALLGSFYWGTLLAWLYTVGSSFIMRIPKDISSHITLFKFLSSLGAVSLLCLTLSMISIDAINGMLSYISAMFIFLFFFCFFIISKQVARAISIWEYNGNIRFWHYLLNFFFIIYFPLGVWFVQPKVKRMINGEIGTRHSKLIEENEVVYSCSACGAKVELGQTRCQQCGETFENT